MLLMMGSHRKSRMRGIMRMKEWEGKEEKEEEEEEERSWE